MASPLPLRVYRGATGAIHVGPFVATTPAEHVLSDGRVQPVAAGPTSTALLQRGGGAADGMTDADGAVPVGVSDGPVDERAGTAATGRAAGYCCGWLRDLTREGVEANPAPDHDSEADIYACKLSVHMFQHEKKDDGTPWNVNRDKCPVCNHPIAVHGDDKQGTPDIHAAAAAAAAPGAPLTVEDASLCIGRVLTWMVIPMQKANSASEDEDDSASAADGGQWIASGQCVCVVHPRILLTATHVCFDGQTPCPLRVLYTPIAGGATQAFSAKLIRYSGRMDVSVLLLDTDASPFTPAAIVPVGSPLLSSACNRITAVLTCFPHIFELLAHPSGNAPVVYAHASQLSQSPGMFPGSITGRLPKSTTHKGITRAFQLVFATFSALAGCSGGAVFATELSAAGAPQLLGVHTQAHTLAAFSPVFVVGASALTQHSAWQPAALLAEVAATPASANASTAAAASEHVQVGIPRAQHEKVVRN